MIASLLARKKRVLKWEIELRTVIKARLGRNRSPGKVFQSHPRSSRLRGPVPPVRGF